MHYIMRKYVGEYRRCAESDKCDITFIALQMNNYDEGASTVTEKQMLLSVQDDILIPLAKKTADYLKPFFAEPLIIENGFCEDSLLYFSIDGTAVQNGYLLKKEGNTLYITGSSLTQTVRGVYSFLEKIAGIRMYTKDILRYEKNELIIPDGTDIEYHPTFEYTDTDWLSPKDCEYSLFNGLNGAAYRDIPEEFGSAVGYISGFGHTLTNQFCDSDKYFKEHPEYFALRHGKRKPLQLCLSNPEVLEIVSHEVFDLLKEKHDPTKALQIVSLTQHDNIAFCTCEKCRALDRKYHSHAGSLLVFVNEIAGRVKKAGYDNVAIDTFAYRYTRTPPEGIVPEDNVIIRLCSIECCFSHALDAADCKTNAEFMKDLRGWSAICDRIYIWDYSTNYCNYVGLFPNFGVLQRNMQIFAENHVKGVYEEGNYSMTAEGEFGELRSFLLSKLLQDPDMNFNAERKSFTEAYYGEASGDILGFLDLITENASSRHLGIYQSMKATMKLSGKQIAYAEKLWSNAKEKTDGRSHNNVLASEISWRWWKKGNHIGEFSSLLSRKKQKEQLLSDIRAAGIERLMEVGEFRSMCVSIFQDWYFKAYPLVSGVLKQLYSVR